MIMPMLYRARLYNKFIEINICVGHMVSQPNRLFQHSTTMSLIIKVLQEVITVRCTIT